MNQPQRPNNYPATNGATNGMNGGMDGHDHSMHDHDSHDHGIGNGMTGKSNEMSGGNTMEPEEEPPIYSTPIVLGVGCIIVLGLGFLAYKKMNNKPEPTEGLLGSEMR